MKDNDVDMTDSELKDAGNPVDDGKAPLKNMEHPERRQGERRSNVERRDQNSIGANKLDRSHPNRRRTGRRVSDKDAKA